MENRCDLDTGSDRVVSIPRSDAKIVGEKRISAELASELELGPRKRVKMRDLEAVCRSGEISTRHTTSLKNKESSDLFLSSEEDMSQVTEVPITLDLDASQAGKTWSTELPVAVDPASRPLGLNAEMDIANHIVQDNSQERPESSGKVTLRKDRSNSVIANALGLDLNAESFLISENQDPFFPCKDTNSQKPRAASECGSCTGPLEDRDSMKLWKEMRQNGFLSSTHGGIPMPKQRNKKSKKDVEQKKKVERAKREVDRFTKIAAPSGLLNELNPGIINHVRNRKQVRSIIESLVRLEKLENDRMVNKQATHTNSGSCEIGNRKDLENLNDSRIHLCHERQPPNTSYVGRQTRGISTLMFKSSLIPEDKDGNGEQTTVERSGAKSFASHSSLEKEKDTLALKLSSLTKTSEDDSPISNEESASYLSIKAATVASQWLGLLLQDIRGRLAALQRSRKRVWDVITTDLPSLISKEFSSDQENDPLVMKNSIGELPGCAIADMHRARWNSLFDQMYKALSEEEDQLENCYLQLKEMQVHCNQGLLFVQGNPEHGPRPHILDNSERALAVRAAAASIYSTCNFLLSTSNLPCF